MASDKSAEGRWRRLVRDFLLLALFFFVHLFILQAVLLSPDRLRQIIEAGLEDHLGQRFEIESVHLSLPDTLDVEGVKSAIGVGEHSSRWLEAEKIHLRVNVYELLRGRFAIREIDVVRPKLTLDLSALPLLRPTRHPVTSSRPAPESTKMAGRPARSGFILDDLSIVDGSVKLLHLPGFKADEWVAFHGITADVNRIVGSQSGYRIAGEMSSGKWLPYCTYRLDIDQKEHLVRGDVRGEWVEIAEDLYRHLPTGVREAIRPYKLNGMFDFDFGFQFDWKSRKADELALRLEFQGVSGEAEMLPYPIKDVYGHLKTDGKDLLIRHVTAQIGGASFQFSGHRLTGGMTDEESWNIGFQGFTFDQKLRNALNEKLRGGWDQFSPKGSLDGQVKLTRRGKERYQLKAEILSKDMEISYQRFPYPCNLLKGKAEFDGAAWKLSDFEFVTGRTRVFLNANLIPTRTGNKHIHLKIYNLPLDERIYQALERRMKPVWEMLSPSGVIDAEYEIIRDGPKSMRFGFRLTGGDPTARYKFFPLPVKVHSGYASWTREKLTLRDVKASRGDTKFHISGDAHQRKPREGDRITVAAENLKLDEALLQSLPPSIQDLWRQLKPTGTTDATFDLLGDEKYKWRYALNVESGDAGIVYESFPYPARVVQGAVEWDPKSARILKVDCRAGKSAIVFQGETFRSKKTPSHLRFEFTDIALDDKLRRAIPKATIKILDEFDVTGRLTGSLLVKFVPGSDSAFELQASAKQGHFVYHRIPIPVTIEQVQLNWDGNGVRLKNLTGKARHGDITLSAVVPADKSQPAEVEIVGKKLELSQSLREALPQSTRKNWEALQAKGDIDLNGKIKWSLIEETEPLYTLAVLCKSVSISHKDIPIPLSELSGDVVVTNDALTITKLTGKSRGSPVSLEGKIAWTESELVPNLTFQAQDLPLRKDFVELLPPTYRKLWPQLNPSGVIRNLKYLVQSPKGKEVERQFVAELADGNLLYSKFPVPFTGLTGRFSWQNGRLKIEDLKGRTLQATVEGSGEFSGEGMELRIATEGLGFSDDLYQVLPATIQEYWKEIKPSGKFDVTTTIKAAFDEDTLTEFQTELALKKAKAIVGLDLDRMTGIFRLNGELLGDALGRIEGSADLKEVWINEEPFHDLTAILDREKGGLVVRELRVRYYGGLLRAKIKASPLLRFDEIFSFNGLASKLAAARNSETPGPAQRIWKFLTPETQKSVTAMAANGETVNGAQQDLLRSINQVLHRPDFYREKDFESITPEVRNFFASFNGKKIPANEVGRYNRLLLEAAFPQEIEPLARRDASNKTLTGIDLALSQVNVAEFAKDLGGDTKLSGALRGDISATFEGKSLDSLQGHGRLHIEDGALWGIPTLGLISNLLNLERENLVREADMQFQLRGPLIEVSALKLTGDQYNIYGYGTIDFEKNIDLKLFVAKRTILNTVVSRIPAVGEVFGPFLESIKGSLYQVELKGPYAKAKPQNVPFKHAVPNNLVKMMHADGKK